MPVFRGQTPYNRGRPPSYAGYANDNNSIYFRTTTLYGWKRNWPDPFFSILMCKTWLSLQSVKTG